MVADGKLVTADVSMPTPKPFPVSTTGRRLLVDVEEMVQLVQSAQNQNQSQRKLRKTVILDTRDAEEWAGISSSPYGRDFSPRARAASLELSGSSGIE